MDSVRECPLLAQSGYKPNGCFWPKANVRVLAEFTIAALELSSIAVLGGGAMTLHAILAENAQKAPDRPWLRFERASWTYAQGDALTDKLAQGLRAQGVEPGDRVALLLANCPELIFC